MSPEGPTMFWPEGTILKIQASRSFKIALEFFRLFIKKKKVVIQKKNIINSVY